MFLILNFIVIVNCYCWNVTWNGNLMNCHPTVVCSNGGMGRCICIDGCEFVSHSQGQFCLNHTKSKPTKTIVYPKQCDVKDSLNVECNFDGLGTVCPNFCHENNGRCVSTDKNVICHPKLGLKCPFDCFYDDKTRRCNPNHDQSVCKLINKTLVCPFNCKYDRDLKVCISSDPNYSCGLEKSLLCPNSCKLNVRGDLCIPKTQYPTAICNKTNIQKCPFGCKYDNTQSICVSKDKSLVICEPFVELRCPYNKFVQEFRDCYFFPNEICWNSEKNIVRYPKRLESKYADVMCEYSNPGKCDTEVIQQFCCN